MFSKIKQFLPGSSRSLHAMHSDLNQVHNELEQIRIELGRLYERVEIADHGTNGNIDYKFDQLTLPKIQQLSDNLRAHDTHMKMFAWEEYRTEGESLDDAKKRFFSSLPRAIGSMRLLQLGCAKLLQEFDAVCTKNDIPYWIDYGTLLGAVRHKGFVPWDDDVDLGMMREDIDDLARIVKDDLRFRITTVYDRFAYCKQVRFSYSDTVLPCFLDLFIYDWAPNANSFILEKQKRIREASLRKFQEESHFDFWNDTPYLPSSDTRSSLIANEFSRCVQEAKNEGIICNEEEATSIIWGTDNVDEGNQTWWSCEKKDIFPLERLEFEGMRLHAPHNYGAILHSHYGDYYELPSDIHTHFKHVDHTSLNALDTKEALEELIR